MSEKLIFFETKDWEQEGFIKKLKEKLLKEFENLEVEFRTESLREANASNYRSAQAVVISSNSLITEEVLEEMPSLRLIITRTTGVDHIDLLSCQKKGIQVANFPYYASITVAEHTFALIFALARKLRKNFEKIQNLDFSRNNLLGMDLFGKTLGVIGTGNIGSHLCRIGYGIGMKVLAYDLNESKELMEKYKVVYTTLNELLQNSDVITIMVPYTKKTHHMINLENIKLVKDEAMLVNAARGPVVDTRALLWALQNGKLQGGVALDVFEGERVLLDKSYLYEDLPAEIAQKALTTLSLLKYPNVIFTPHIAYYTKEAIERLMESILENLKSYFKYRSLKTHYESYF
ncbi:MAG: NAD(P)-dependent oxidoreductase [Caldimicrobium sp.]